MKTRLSLLLLCSTLFASFVGAEEYDGLVIYGDYRELPVLVTVKENDLGITEESLIRTIKLRLLANNITYKKAFQGMPHSLNVFCNIVKLSANNYNNLIKIELIKSSKEYINQEFHTLGNYVKPEQGSYGTFGNVNKTSTLIDAINEQLDRFILDYLETNIKFRKVIDEMVDDLVEKAQSEATKKSGK